LNWETKLQSQLQTQTQSQFNLNLNGENPSLCSLSSATPDLTFLQNLGLGSYENKKLSLNFILQRKSWCQLSPSSFVGHPSLAKRGEFLAKLV
jgi:hypothetical protein